MAEEFLKFYLGETMEEAEAVHKEFAPLLNIISRSYSLGTGLDKADLFGEAMVGLARAKRDFDIERSENFKNFAIFKIKDALNKFVRENMCSVSIPGYIKDTNAQINRLRKVLECAEVDNSKIDIIISEGKVYELEMPADLYEEATKIVGLIKNASRRAGVSYKTMVSRAMFLPLDDFNIEDCSQEDDIESKTLVSQLFEIMDETDQQIALMIMEDKTKSEIARHFGKSPTWVNNRLNAIKEKVL